MTLVPQGHQPDVVNDKLAVQVSNNNHQVNIDYVLSDLVLTRSRA